MSRKKGWGRFYDRLTPEERFRLNILALAREDQEESERLVTTCRRRTYTMYDREFVGRLRVAWELTMRAYVDVARCLDKIEMIAALRSALPHLRTISQEELRLAILYGHEMGSQHAWKWSGKAGEPPGWEADEEDAKRNADPAIDETLQKWMGHSEGGYALFERELEEIERKHVRQALTVWSAFADFCAKELGLEAEKLLEALARPFAERVRELEELSARHEVEPEEGVEEYLAILTEAWRSTVEAA